ncbi:MAG: hypothetical protein Q7R22_012395 [Verrucomicrobiota bacterium JB025]
MDSTIEKRMTNNSARTIDGAPPWSERLLRYKWPLLVLLLCQVGQMVASLLLPSFSDDLIDTGIGSESPSAIRHYGGLMTIARAFLLDAPILIPDEATSSVDTRTKKHAKA